jgi:hypothetical protein
MDIPPPILKRLVDCESEARSILAQAAELITDFDYAKVGFKVTAASPLPIMPFNLPAQSLTFVIRYDHLPEHSEFTAGRHPQSNLYYLNEIDLIRAALNEYRTIFFNQQDGIYYRTITNTYQRVFLSELPHSSMKYSAVDKDGIDHSELYLKHLSSRRKAIQRAIELSDFPFIFNAVLQHSDDKQALEMVKSYTDGSLAYTLLKNFIIAQGLKDFLKEHYRVIRALNFPAMGPL